MCWLLFFIFLMFFDCCYLIVCKTLSKTNVFRRQTSEIQKKQKAELMFLTARLQKNKKTLSKTNVFHCQTSEKLKNIKQNQSQTSEKQWQTKKDLGKKKKDQKRRQGMEGAGECGWEGEGTRSCIFFYKCVWFFSKWILDFN